MKLDLNKVLILKGSEAAAAPKVGEPPQFSDIRLKTDIAKVSTLRSGIPVYSFKYVEMAGYEHLDTHTTFVGVMAQDLLADHADAVTVDDNGYYRVNYGKLGFEMTTLDAWKPAKTYPH